MGNLKNRISKVFRADHSLMRPKNDEWGGIIKVKSIIQPIDDDSVEDVRCDCEDCD